MHKRNTRIVWAFLLAGIVLSLATLPSMAQGEELRLSRRKDFGFSSGNQMQGRFTFTVTGPQDLASATLYIDGQEMGTRTVAPFAFSFDTGSYPAGQHVVYAAGQTAGGRELRSTEVTVNFLNAAQAAQATQRIVIPLIAAILLLTALGAGGSAWMASRNAARPGQHGAPRIYGPAGGAICPRCSRPFPLPLFAPNMVTGKLVRCPYCGKWSIVRRARPEALAAAEAAEVAGSQPAVPEMSPEEKLRRQIEESRYRS